MLLSRRRTKEPISSKTIQLSSLLEILECPVCCNVPRSPPVFQCSNGHMVCQDCRPKLAVCHSCREPQDEIRNRALERLLDIIPLECSFAKNGCNGSMTGENLHEHEKQCQFRFGLLPKCESHFQIAFFPIIAPLS